METKLISRQLFCNIRNFTRGKKNLQKKKNREWYV